MTMRSNGGYAWCDHCERLFASHPDGPRGITKHPTANEYPDMPSELVYLYGKCPNAGKYFKHPVMEEVLFYKEERSQ